MIRKGDSIKCVCTDCPRLTPHEVYMAETDQYVGMDGAVYIKAKNNLGQLETFFVYRFEKLQAKQKAKRNLPEWF